MAHVSPQDRHLFDNTGTDIGVIFFGGEEDGFEPWLKLAIHESHLKFEFKIRDGTKSANDRKDILLTRKIDKQSIQGNDFYRRIVAQTFAKHGDPVFHTEHRCLRLARRHSDDNR